MSHSATISPFLRSPFTDITGGMLSHQADPSSRCASIEMEMMECLEWYGLDRGLKKCQCWIQDYRECHGRFKQFARFVAMRRERDRQIRAGKLTGKDKYLDPEIDSY